MPQALPTCEIVKKASVKVTVEQMRKWRERKCSPICKRINGRYYYRLDDFERFLKDKN